MSEKIFRQAQRILLVLGYCDDKRDRELLKLCVEDAESCFLAYCGLKAIPDEAVKNIAMGAVGEFFAVKKSLCQLDGFIPEAGAVKSVSEGDTSLTFRGDEAPLDEVIRFLRRAGKADGYRRLKW